ncbi:hypothetical protein [Mesorhizobium sp. M8A.F.Ca.ET.165.01.1.1]|uniref:hypothetical protein n=1 Tax=Mesorhizobium sp. M8A.F.Ca.ET.165.01.1.1 TaxID=2563960 RepID=UPI001093E447|nr:hypothetical protein [Mesorhizobium sp. M8A.F.Ca.ET.165.01.1.1]TGT35768.1 hypothetical protein EN808_31470 [Mesorhizobium sp. M8A.F.Ca.ET.165.01.1.1]
MAYSDQAALVESFIETLSEATGNPVSPLEQSGEPLRGALLYAQIDDRPVRLSIELKRSLLPLDEREPVWRMRDIAAASCRTFHPGPFGGNDLA